LWEEILSLWTDAEIKLALFQINVYGKNGMCAQGLEMWLQQQKCYRKPSVVVCFYTTENPQNWCVSTLQKTQLSC